MSYAARTDLEARFGAGELERLDGTGRIESALEDSTAEVDAHLAPGYALPLPAGRYPLLTGIACDLARLALHDNAPQDVVLARARTARKRLTELAGGTLALIDANGEAVRRKTGGTRTAGPGPVMTGDNLAGL